MHRTYWLLLLLTIFYDHVFGQNSTGQITGRVVSAEGMALANVQISIQKIDKKVITAEDGRFVVAKVAPGNYAIKFEHIGFEPRMIDNIQIAPDAVYDLGRIVLTPRCLPLREIIVTATRVENLPFEVAAPVNIVPLAQLAERAVRTTAEALREEPGIFVQKTNHGGGSASFRGLGSNQILILVDGIRLNNATYRLGNHQYLTTIDPNALAQIEVIRGPNSVLYGSDALGGAINLITKKPSFAATGAKVAVRWLNRYASADAEKTSHAELALTTKRWAWMSGFTYQDIGDLKRGQNSQHSVLEKSKNGVTQSPTGFRAYAADVKWLFKATPQQAWTLAYQRCRQEKVPRYDKYENDDYYRWLYHPQARDLVYLAYENQFQVKFLQPMQAAISWQRQAEGREMQSRPDTDLTRENDRVNTLGISLQLNPTFARHRLVYGFECYRDQVASQAVTVRHTTGTEKSEPRGRYPDNARYLSFGVFAQEQWEINARLKTLFGGRGSYFKADFQGATSPVQQEFKAITGSAGFIYSLTAPISVSGNVSQGFRAPNLSDITKLGESKGQIYEVPNFDLRPEKILNLDIGCRIHSDLLKATFSAYYARIYDLIASSNTSYHGATTIFLNGATYHIKSKQNIGQAYIRGLEAAFNYQVTNTLYFSGNISSARGQNVTLNEPVGGIPPAFGRLELKWNGGDAFAAIFTRFATKQTRLSADDQDDPRIPVGGTPGWHILSLRTGLKVSDWCQLQAALENIFDINYREHGSGVNGPGRNLILSVELGNSGR